jgi:hypothetical protein
MSLVSTFLVVMDSITKLEVPMGQILLLLLEGYVDDGQQR